MQWKSHETGEVRSRSGFLLIPRNGTTTTGEKLNRWLENADWTETCSVDENGVWWAEVKWLDI